MGRNDFNYLHGADADDGSVMEKYRQTEQSAEKMADVQKLMEDYIDGLFDPMDKSLRNKAKMLLDTYPGITRFHGMDEFVAASFLPVFFKATPHHTGIPVLNKAAIRDQYERVAALRLDEAIEAEKVGLHQGGPGRI